MFRPVIRALPRSCFWSASHHISSGLKFAIFAAYITPQTLNNFIVHHFIIIHSHPILYHITIQK